MGLCMSIDTTILDVAENHTAIQSTSQTNRTQDDPPFEMNTSAGAANGPIFFIDTSIMKHLPDNFNSPIRKPMASGIAKQVPFVIQRTLREPDIYKIPNVNIIFVLDTEEQKSEILSNLKRLTEISGRLHHVDMMATFLEVASVIDSKDVNIIPPIKALEVFIHRISSETENVDALLVTGYPRNMRDVVEYMTRVQRIGGVILLLDPKYEPHESEESVTDSIDKYLKSEPDSIERNDFRLNVYPIIKFFNQENLLHTVTLERPLLDVFHDVYDKVLLILSRLPQSEEKEIPEVAQTQTPESVIQSGKAKRSQSTSATLNLKQQVINKDIQDVLSLVRAGSMMGRVSSAQSKQK